MREHGGEEIRKNIKNEGGKLKGEPSIFLLMRNTGFVILVFQ